ncbi:MAG: class F sortase [Thermomicrobiales bacterium]
MIEHSIRINRRVALGAAASLAVGAAAFAMRSAAQESTPVAVGTPAAGFIGIQPIGVGEVPTTGAARPGPANEKPILSAAGQIAPVGLAVPSAGIDAGIERLRVIDGAMPDPTGPWVVAWYENLGSLGRAGNVVMAGHIDYWNVGPSVFYNLATLQPGDDITVSGNDGKVYPYTVDWVRQYNSSAMPLDELTSQSDGQDLTLITCGGAFDYVNGHYLQRTVVRATRTGAGLTAAT